MTNMAIIMRTEIHKPHDYHIYNFPVIKYWFIEREMMWRQYVADLVAVQADYQTNKTLAY